ncbi:hypothetical protein L6164_007570 [Bauhinia variegata]|uniref:Uncharacterized protein n=1 Tax=Bauhinia variegata TaxID=167791 RepID=A0ACB9PF31_BAUVA|nr:hypothetical protein L6164_007570 [Bauhinia variegata]
MEINSERGITNSTDSRVNSIDGDIASDSDPNFGRMLPTLDSATLVTLVPVLTVCPRGFGGRPYRDCLNPGPGISVPRKGDNCGSPYNRACSV